MNTIVQKLTPSRWHSDKSRQLAAKVKAKVEARNAEEEEEVSRGIFSDEDDEYVLSEPEDAYSDDEDYPREEEAELLLEEGEISMDQDPVGARLEAEREGRAAGSPTARTDPPPPRVNRADDPRAERPVRHYGARDSSWTTVCHRYMTNKCLLSTSPRAVRRSVVSPPPATHSSLASVSPAEKRKSETPTLSVTPADKQKSATLSPSVSPADKQRSATLSPSVSPAEKRKTPTSSPSVSPAEKRKIPTSPSVSPSEQRKPATPSSSVSSAEKRKSMTLAAKETPKAAIAPTTAATAATGASSSSRSPAPTTPAAKKSSREDITRQEREDSARAVASASSRASTGASTPVQASQGGSAIAKAEMRDDDDYHSPLDHLRRYEKMSAAGWELHKFSSRLSQLARQLKSLDMSWNWVKSVSYSQISQFSSLQYLSLRGNVLQHLPEPLGEVKTLLMLDLSYNSLRVAPMGMKDAFPSLVYLNLSYNRISSDFWEALPSLPMSELTKAKKAKKEKAYAAIALPTSLKVLDVSNNRLTSLPWSWFSPADPEEELSSSRPGTPVQKGKKRRWPSGKKQVEQLSVGGSLECLYAAHNAITKVPAWLPAAAPRLEVLWLRGNSLGVPYLDALTREKDKRGSELSQEVVAEFWRGIQGLESLQELSLSGNFLSDALWVAGQHQGVWARLKSLRLLDVSNNAIVTLPEDLFAHTFLPDERETSGERKRESTPHLSTSGRSKSFKEVKSGNKGNSLPLMQGVTSDEDEERDLKEDDGGRASTTPTMGRKRSGTVTGAISARTEDSSDSSDSEDLKEKTKMKRNSLARLTKSYGSGNNVVDVKTGLQVLNLSLNRITHVPASVLNRLPGLRYLNIAHNCIDVLPKEIIFLKELRQFFYHRYSFIPSNTTCVSKQLSDNDIVKETMPVVKGPEFSANLRLYMPHLEKISLTVVACAFTVPEVKMTPKQFAWLPQVCEILPGLYLSSEFGARREHHLTSLGITHILSVITGFDVHFPSDYEYLVHKVEDVPSTNLRRFFAETNAFIDAGRRAGGVLVHCAAGVSRSATLCAAYIVHTQKITTRRAISMMHAKRPIVGPNSGFVHQLFDYEMMTAKVGPKVAEDPLAQRARREQQHKAVGSGTALLQGIALGKRSSETLGINGGHLSSPAGSPLGSPLGSPRLQTRVEKLKRAM